MYVIRKRQILLIVFFIFHQKYSDWFFLKFLKTSSYFGELIFKISSGRASHKSAMPTKKVEEEPQGKEGVAENSPGGSS